MANVLSLGLVLLPSPGMVTYCRMRRAWKGWLRSFQLAWGSVARPYRDFVTLKRILYGREDVSTWRIIERNSDEVASLRETGQSFIVATAHLHDRHCSSRLPQHHTWQSDHGRSSAAKRDQISARFEAPDPVRHDAQGPVFCLAQAWRICIHGLGSVCRQSAMNGCASRNVVCIHVDAPWPNSPTGSYSRPFAGLRDRAFSTGATQLAALTRCPIVSCVYWQQDDETVIIEWGSPIQLIGARPMPWTV